MPKIYEDLLWPMGQDTIAEGVYLDDPIIDEDTIIVYGDMIDTPDWK